MTNEFVQFLDRLELNRARIWNTNLAPRRRQTASITVCTSSGGFVKTRISEMSLLSSASRACKYHRSHNNWLFGLTIFLPAIFDNQKLYYLPRCTYLSAFIPDLAMLFCSSQMHWCTWFYSCFAEPIYDVNEWVKLYVHPAWISMHNRSFWRYSYQLIQWPVPKKWNQKQQS